MTLGWSAAFLPGAPALLPQLTGIADREDLLALRAACATAVRDVLRGGPSAVVCIGGGALTRQHAPDVWGTVAGLGVPVSTAPAAEEPAARSTPPSLPLSLTLARLQLEAAGWTGPVVQQEVAAGATRQECARIAAALPLAGTAWLVVADGSTARTPRAPGGFDERSEGFDLEVEQALRSADPDRLLALDPGLADELGATGRAPWSILAEAARQVLAESPSASIDAEVGYAGAPLGVGYLAGTWQAVRPDLPGATAPPPVQHPRAVDAAGRVTVR